MIRGGGGSSGRVNALLTALDLVVHPNTSETERASGILGSRRLLGGRTIKDYLTPDAVAAASADTTSAIAELQKQCAELNTQLAETTKALDEAKSEAARLREENDRLREQLANLPPPQADPVEGGFVTFEIFQLAVIEKTKTVHYQQAYSQASHTHGCQAVDIKTIRTWVQRGKVPDWAFKQINQMSFVKTKRVNVRWTPDEIAFLVAEAAKPENRRNDNKEPNYEILARKCSEQFGREITKDAVGGQLDRARRRVKVPLSTEGGDVEKA